jgi:hypothetical protein
VDVLSGKCKEIIIICNNTTNGKAVANSLQLLSAFREGTPVQVPRSTLRAFPFLQDIAGNVETENLLADNQTYRKAI